MNFTKHTVGSWRGQANLSYLLKLCLIRRRDVAKVMNPLIERGTLTLPVSGISFVSTPVVYEFDFPNKAAGMSVESEAGIWNTSISAEMPKVVEDHLLILSKNRQEEYVAMAVDANGQMRIAGDEELGMRMRVSESIQGRNFITMALTLRSDQPVWFGVASTIEEMMPGADFSYEFSFDFNS